MKTYTLPTIQEKISSAAMTETSVTIELVRITDTDASPTLYYTGVSITDVDGAKVYPMSQFRRKETAYANLENLYVEIALAFDGTPNVVIREEIVDQTHEVKRRYNANFHVMNDVLAVVDATARAYCATVANDYIIGVEHNGDQYPIMAAKDATEADYLTEEMTRAIEHHFGVTTPATFDDEEADMLAGFTFVPNKGMATIRIYTNNRLQLKGDIKTLLGVSPRQRILIAFNPELEAFAIVKPSALVVTNEMRAAGYFVSQRKDVACAKLFREFHLDKYEGQTFYADKASLSGNVVVFKR